MFFVIIFPQLHNSHAIFLITHPRSLLPNSRFHKFHRRPTSTFFCYMKRNTFACDSGMPTRPSTQGLTQGFTSTRMQFSARMCSRKATSHPPGCVPGSRHHVEDVILCPRISAPCRGRRSGGGPHPAQSRNFQGNVHGMSARMTLESSPWHTPGSTAPRSLKPRKRLRHPMPGSTAPRGIVPSSRPLHPLLSRSA